MSNKITIAIIILLIIFSTLGYLGIRTYSHYNYYSCENGEWRKQGYPLAKPDKNKCQKPVKNSPEDKKMDEELVEEENVNSNQEIYNATNDLKIYSPGSNDTISNPLVIEGEAMGIWFFEGSFPVRVVDEQGKEIGVGYAQALGEWMKLDFVPFRAVIEINKGTSKKGEIILSPDDPSGMNKVVEVKIPVQFGNAKKQTVNVFFGSTYYDFDGLHCESYAVNRIISPTLAVARAAIEELLKGPDELEKKAGFFTNINSGVKIQKLTIANGIAKIDFNGKLEEGIGGSCQVSIIRSQITETLKQFPTIRDVIISINGRTEDILQP